MYSTRLSRLMQLVVALLALFAFGAMVASAAQAEGTEKAPFWSVKGARLGQGETRFITAKATNTFVLTDKTSKVKVECTGLNTKEAVLLGSKEGEPGKSDEVLEFSTCKVVNNGSSCTVTEPIATRKLKNELVEDAATKKKLLVEFFPEKGSTFTTLVFASSCTVLKGEASVTGKEVAEALTDPGELPIELGGTERGSAKSWLLKALPAQPTHVWLVKEGTGKEEPLEEFQFDGTAAELAGTALVSLVSEEEWSPLA